jgi:hypothetical protein
MNGQALMDIARTLVHTGKGLLAIDESTPTCALPLRFRASRSYREGKRGEVASARLNAMHVKAKAATSRLPWALEPASDIWGGDESHRGAAGRVHR